MASATESELYQGVAPPPPVEVDQQQGEIFMNLCRQVRDMVVTAEFVLPADLRVHLGDALLHAAKRLGRGK